MVWCLRLAMQLAIITGDFMDRTDYEVLLFAFVIVFTFLISCLIQLGIIK